MIIIVVAASNITIMSALTVVVVVVVIVVMNVVERMRVSQGQSGLVDGGRGDWVFARGDEVVWRRFFYGDDDGAHDDGGRGLGPLRTCRPSPAASAGEEGGADAEAAGRQHGREQDHEERSEFVGVFAAGRDKVLVDAPAAVVALVFHVDAAAAAAHVALRAAVRVLLEFLLALHNLLDALTPPVPRGTHRFAHIEHVAALAVAPLLHLRQGQQNHAAHHHDHHDEASSTPRDHLPD